MITVTPLATTIGTASLLIASVMTAAPANAAVDASPSPDDRFSISSVDPAALERLELVDSAVDRTTRTFDAAIARDRGATPEEVQDYAEGFRAGGGTVIGIDVASGDVARALRACRGRNAADYTGLQANISLSSCISSTLAYQLTGSGISLGATVAVLTAATGVGAPVAAVVAAGLGVGGYIFSGCEKKGTGTAIHAVPPTAAIWCNAQ